MSINNPFFLRSSNGSGAMFFKVSDNQVSEICLFNDRFTYELYPLDLQRIIARATTSSLAEVPAQIFEEAQIKFLEQVQFRPVVELLPPTQKQIEQAATVADALKEDLLF
jgi:hypothetical protein